MTSWWNEHSYGRPIYAGLAYYKLNNGHIDPRKDASWQDQNEIFEQVDDVRNLCNFGGMCFYSQGSFNRNRRLFTNELKTDYFTHPALQPLMPWLSNTTPKPPTSIDYEIKSDSVEIHWDSGIVEGDEKSYQYAVYVSKAGESFDLNSGKNLMVISRSNSIVFHVSDVKNANIFVTSLDRLHNESKSFVGTFIKVE